MVDIEVILLVAVHPKLLLALAVCLVEGARLFEMNLFLMP
jgi:hypothetical protein